MRLTPEPSPSERLEILQQTDGHRAWRSLHERRFCVRCTKVFNGYEVKIAIQGNGHHQLQCPTDGCDSMPIHWFFYGSRLASQSTNATLPLQSEIDFGDF
jgi:hypothetical protein